jgi:hypothetical protein
VRTLPTTMIQVLAPFAPLFSEGVFRGMSSCFWRVRRSPRPRGP